MISAHLFWLLFKIGTWDPPRNPNIVCLLFPIDVDNWICWGKYKIGGGKVINTSILYLKVKNRFLLSSNITNQMKQFNVFLCFKNQTLASNSWISFIHSFIEFHSRMVKGFVFQFKKNCDFFPHCHKFYVLFIFEWLLCVRKFSFLRFVDHWDKSLVLEELNQQHWINKYCVTL